MTKGGSLHREAARSKMEQTPAIIHPADAVKWSRIVTSKRSLFDLQLGEVWRYRDLIYLFVKRDFVATYKQTILGPLWFLIQPLLSTVVFTIIFGNIAKLPTDNIPHFLFYLCGLVAWSYFADCLNKSASTFSGNAAIFSKVYFPRLTVPIANAITNLMTFAIQFGLFLVVLVYFTWKGAPIHTSWRVIVLSLYPPEWQWLLVLNPRVPVIESFRFAFLGAGTVEVYQLVLGSIVSLAVFVCGIVIFRHVESTFSDTI